MDDVGVSLDSVLRILSARQGKAVLLLGLADEEDLDMTGSALRAGVGAMAVPTGLTVIRTNPITAANVLNGPLTEPEAVIGRRFATNPRLTVEGFLPLDWVLMPGEVIVDQPDEDAGPTEAELNAEAALWDRTTASDTVQAYRNYVARYPQGRFVNDAEAQIEAILAEPNRAARLAEEALGLNRSACREIQSNLTLLNYNTRGVDGIFGRGTRGAITNWQQSNGFPQTSYMTRDQISLLDAQAARRRAEIEAEEAREQAQQDALDRSNWSETGAVGDEPGYRAYLARYPQGHLFANIARARLGEIEERRRGAAEVADRAAWSLAESENSVAGYQEYLASYPNGVFTNEARNIIQQMSEPRVTNGQVERTRQEESRLRLTGVRAQLLELRLRDIGYNPGRLDGVIDDQTRGAIMEYQGDNGVIPTGYVDQATAVGLMSGSLTITLPGR